MEHLTLKAVTTPMTDQGVFEAVISTASIDREKDIVDPAALVKALKKWNRPIPLTWHHSTAPEDIFGSIEPMTVREVEREVVVGGQVDLESKQGAEAWRSFKAGSIGFSYGYLVPDGGSVERKGGGRHITELDVFEITATRAPMNNDTRVLGWKSIPPEELPDVVVEALGSLTELSDDDRQALAAKAVEALGLEYPQEAEEADGDPAGVRSVDPLEEASRQAVAGVRLDGIPERKSPVKDPDPPEGLPSEAELREQFRDVTLQLLRGI